MSASPYELLEPAVWRNLLARASIYHALRGRLGQLCDLADRSPSVRLALLELGLAARWSAEGAQLDADDQEIVHRVVERWSAAIDRVLDDETLESPARALLESLRAGLDDACGTDPIRHMLAAIESRAADLYGDSWRRVSLSLGHLRSHPRGQDAQRDPYTVSATTAWPPAEHEAEIRVLIYCEEFGPAAYAALPAVLLHECICHVPARQDRAANTSIFAEGFLDWVAHRLLDLWIGRLDPQLAAAALRHARALHQILLSSTGIGTAAAAARVAGHMAADDLRVWFETEGGVEPEESVVQVRRLAIELNQVDAALDAKDHFISRLAPPVPPDVQEGLRRWVDHDVTTEDLLHALVPLARAS